MSVSDPARRAPVAALSFLASAAAVFVGGMLGTALRMALDLAFAPHDVVTLAGNVAGSFVLGVLVARTLRVPAWLRAGMRSGVLGGFTTFSALSLALSQHAGAGAFGIALLLAAASLVLGIAAATLGLVVGGRRRAPIEDDE